MFHSFCVKSALSACLALIVSVSVVQLNYSWGYSDPNKEETQQGYQQKEFPDVEEGEEDEPEEAPGLLGDFLHGRGGLSVEYTYIGEVFTNMRGGVNTRDAVEYLGLFDLALTADLDEMCLIPGGTVFILAEDLHGRAISGPHAGDFQLASNIDGEREFTQVSEFWWERGLLDDLVAFRLGKQDANAVFGVVDLGGDFVNSSFGMAPNILMPAWPDPAMGVILFFKPNEKRSFKVGVFDGAATGGSWGFSGTGTTSTIGELKTEWGLGCDRLHGDFHVGLWYHSDQFDDLSGGGTFTGNHGVYLGLGQMLFRECPCDEENDQGLGVFAQYGWAPEDRNETPHYISAGLVYKGLLSCRDDDTIGLGVAHVIFSDRLTNQEDETAIEFFYKVQVSSHIVMQPDFQFIASPSGQHRDAFVFGLRFEVAL